MGTAVQYGTCVKRESSIKSAFEADERNRKTVYTRVGPAAVLPDDVAELYELHRDRDTTAGCGC